MLEVGEVTPGTSATRLGKAVDGVAGATDTGVVALGIRDDALTTLTPIDGDYVPFRVGSTGALHVQNGVPLDRLTDNIGVALQTDVIMNDTTALTPKWAFANVAQSQTDSQIVAAVSSKKIRVLSFRLHTGGTATNVTFNSKPGGGGAAITELFACGANGGRSEGFSPVGHFETASGEGLTVTTGAGSTTGVAVCYIEV